MVIFHIAHASEWEAARANGEYHTSTRGLSLEEVGFIHASSASQVAGVATSFFRDDPERLVVLEIDEQGLDVRWEDGGQGERFPHIYQALPPASVTAAVPCWFAGGEFRWTPHP